MRLFLCCNGIIALKGDQNGDVSLRTSPFSQPFGPYLAYVIWTLAATSRFILTLSQRKQHVENRQGTAQFDLQGLDSFSLFSLLRL